MDSNRLFSTAFAHGDDAISMMLDIHPGIK
jgi:hypothetical protein